ncbi:MAG: helix-turn-helix domain-containing protein [[Lactobacillus] timonensis]|nr:helix-turn-helix domain-containing protein [[Lactobacillus] timonensis]
MDVNINLPPELQRPIKQTVVTAVTEAIETIKHKNDFPPYMTQREACKYLHISATTFNRWNIPVTQIEGVKRYHRESLDHFMKQREH